MKGGTRKRGKSWSYYFDAAQMDGKRKKIEKGGFRTKKDAEAALAKALAEYGSSGEVFSPAKIGVADHLDFWMEQYVELNLSNNTIETYRSIIKNHIKPRFGSHYLASVRPAMVQEFINDLKVEGYSKMTIEIILYILSSAMDYAIEPLQYIKDNPCRLVKIGKVHKQARERHIITDEQFLDIMKLFPPGDRFYIPIMIGWNCGTRINECIGLSWDDIDLKEMSVKIDKQAVRRSTGDGGAWLLKEPKNNSSRVVRFGETLTKALKAERKRQRRNEMLYGEYYTVYYIDSYTDEKGATHKRIEKTTKGELGDRERFFPVCLCENGVRMSPNMFANCVKKVKKELDIPFDYHSIRHTHATKLIEAGVNAKAVQSRMGHKKIATTMNTYVHSTDAMAKEAAAIFEKAVNGLPPR